MSLSAAEIKVVLTVLACLFAGCAVRWIADRQFSIFDLLLPLLGAGAALVAVRVFVVSGFERYLQQKSEGKSVGDPSAGGRWDSLLEQYALVRTRPLDELLASTRANLADLTSKETELRLPKRIEEDIRELTASQPIMDKVVHVLAEEMKETLLAVAAFKPSTRDDGIHVCASAGFQETALSRLQNWIVSFLTQSIASEDVLIYTSKQWPLADIGIGERDALLVLPVTFSGRFLGLLVMASKGNADSLARVKAAVKQLADILAGALYRAAVAEDIVEQQRRDKLTGCLNRFALEETLEPLDRDAWVSLMLVEGNSFVQFNESLGRTGADQLVRALAETAQGALQKGEDRGWFRVAAAQFVLLVEGVDSAGMLRMAERIKNAVDRRQSWPGNVSNWTVSVAIVESGGRLLGKEMLAAAEDTISYMRQNGLANRILYSSQLPKNFSAKKKSTAGFIGLSSTFDPVALLKNAGLSGATGVLKINSANRPEFWAFYADGRPFKARLGKLHGNDAILELLTVFDSGDYKFAEVGPDSLTGTGDDVSKLGNSYTVTDLDKLIDESVTLQNQLVAARTLIPKANLYARVIDGANTYQKWEDLRTIKSPPSDTDIKLMVQILRLANGQMRLSEIFAMLDEFPTSRLWHCSALLLEHGFMRLNQLKVYAMPGQV